MAKPGKFAVVEDVTGCYHEFIVGPQRKIKQFFVGHCDSCKREVVLELDKADERTGKSWLIEYENLDVNTLDFTRLKKQVVDGDGIRNAVDDVLTNRETDSLSMEDTHEELPEPEE